MMVMVMVVEVCNCAFVVLWAAGLDTLSAISTELDAGEVPGNIPAVLMISWTLCCSFVLISDNHLMYLCFWWTTLLLTYHRWNCWDTENVRMEDVRLDMCIFTRAVWFHIFQSHIFAAAFLTVLIFFFFFFRTQNRLALKLPQFFTFFSLG